MVSHISTMSGPSPACTADVVRGWRSGQLMKSTVTSTLLSSPHWVACCLNSSSAAGTKAVLINMLRLPPWRNAGARFGAAAAWPVAPSTVPSAAADKPSAEARFITVRREYFIAFASAMS